MKKVLFSAMWLIIWFVIALIVNNEIFFPGPAAVIAKLLDFLRAGEFYICVSGSLVRIAVGFGLSYLAAYICAFISFKYNLFYNFIYPLVMVFKTVPVASVVVIIGIIAGVNNVTYIVTGMMVFPVVFLNIYEGLKKTDIKILEMLEAYNVGLYNRYNMVYVPAISNYITSAVKTSLGLAFKSGVAAEVICQARDSIGFGIYTSKIYLDTPGVLAYTFTVMILSYVMEKVLTKVVLLLLKSRKVKAVYKDICMKEYILKADNITKSYGDNLVLDNISIEAGLDSVLYVTAQSGKGKTTLLNIISGIDKDYSGQINLKGLCFSYLFQENRLIEDMTVKDNLSLAASFVSENMKTEYLKAADLENAYNMKVSELSGGMKRRIALLKALFYPSDIILLDEPFTGLDEINALRMTDIIKKLQNNRLIIVASHDKAFMDRLNGHSISL